jgi:hypothetical protein
MSGRLKCHLFEFGFENDEWFVGVLGSVYVEMVSTER